MRRNLSTGQYLDGIKKGDFAILARAISLVESANPDHRKMANEILENLPKNKTAKIIGISGTPGVGKSTFVESLGCFLVDTGLKIAVLAIDPTSVKTGGSILGDKTRMQRLSASANAFIRPSASGSTLGGVQAKTRESIHLCESFGFDVIIVETVGVGQSEMTVSQMVDFFLLLMQPGSGDDLQGIKRGILEVCHLVAVNKADGDLYNKALVAKSEYQMALKILRSQEDYSPTVMTCSALENTGIDRIWETIEKYFKTQDINKIRESQLKDWFDSLIKDELIRHLHESEDFTKEKEKRIHSIKENKVSIIESSTDLVKNIFAGKFK